MQGSKDGDTPQRIWHGMWGLWDGRYGWVMLWGIKGDWLVFKAAGRGGTWRLFLGNGTDNGMARLLSRGVETLSQRSRSKDTQGSDWYFGVQASCSQFVICNRGYHAYFPSQNAESKDTDFFVLALMSQGRPVTRMWYLLRLYPYIPLLASN